MKKEQKFLSADAFKKAALFLNTNARHLERARFENIFASGSVGNVWIELLKFQNADGGFGHALEPDLRAPESSALCTSVAFQIMRCHKIPEREPFVRHAIRYLADTLDRNALHWRIIPEGIDAYPHAPWWNQEGREAGFNAFSLNPTAEILGIVLDGCVDDFGRDIVSRHMDRVIDKLDSVQKIEMHDLLCCLRLLETDNLPSTVRGRILEALKRLVSGSIATNPDQWKGYCLRPLQVIHRPDSPFMEGLEEAVALNLDYEIEEQMENGTWSPTWSWGDQFPQAWEEAKREWTGVLTLEKLITLKHFNRIAPIAPRQ
ncbi:MAG: hypothetical protein JJU29_18740 [Verrucomicrobia bacterium]|nr:hypothetical protein [Verrucomicrobiota bacterium]MCH8511365.1 hypothetical protein [Kiritimatiellia bacterium]